MRRFNHDHKVTLRLYIVNLTSTKIVYLEIVH